MSTDEDAVPFTLIMLAHEPDEMVKPGTMAGVRVRLTPMLFAKEMADRPDVELGAFTREAINDSYRTNPDLAKFRVVAVLARGAMPDQTHEQKNTVESFVRQHYDELLLAAIENRVVNLAEWSNT